MPRDDTAPQPDAVTALRVRLRKNGYRPIPADGKAVRLPDWPAAATRGDPSEYPRWRTTFAYEVQGEPRTYRGDRHTNTGLLCGDEAAPLVGADIDVPMPDLAARVEALARTKLGRTPLRRVGQAPKVLLLYRTSRPVRKIATPELFLPDGTKVQVEILGQGQQAIAYGTHPDTRGEYEWTESGPDVVPLGDLPLVPEAALHEFITAAEALLRAAGGQTKKEREAATEKPTHTSTGPNKPRPTQTLPKRSSAGGDSFFKQVNRAALDKLDAWVPLVFGAKARRQATGGYRITSADLGRDYQEDLSIHPNGVQDFGPRKGMSPCDVVMEFGGAPSVQDATFKLCEWLGRTPADFGWQKAPPKRDHTPTEAAGSTPSNQPIIRLEAGDIARIVDEAEAALIAADLDFYQRGAFIVRPGMVRIAVADDRTVLGQRVVQAGDHALLEALASAARWEKYYGRSKEYVRTNPPLALVKVYRDRVGRWRLPVLTGIVNAPTLRPDGSVLFAPGYDAATGLLFDPCGATFPQIPDQPTRETAAAALEDLKDLIGTFPFVGDADRSVALSAILTACIRRSLPTAPMHAFSAPAAGTGKSMLVDIPSIITSGREAGVIAQGSSEEETEKRLGSLLLAGDAVIAIDNCEAPLGGEFLCQVLTQPVVKARILGRSEAPELPSGAFVTATGNNLTLAGDLTRRALLCRLDAQCERPELRAFERDPVAVAKAQRGRLTVAALTVLRAYHVAGRPQQEKPLGSFGEWSRWVRDALQWLGEADPVATMEFARASDPRLASLTAVIEQWAAVIGGARVTTRTLIEQATQIRTMEWGRQEFVHPDFREALLAVAGAGGAVNSSKLGYWLRSNRDRVAAGYRIVQGTVLHGSPTWALVRT